MMYLYMHNVQVGPVPQDIVGFKTWLRGYVYSRTQAGRENTVRDLARMTKLEYGDVLGFLAHEYPGEGYRELGYAWNRVDLPAITWEDVMERIIARCEPHRADWCAKGCALTF